MIFATSFSEIGVGLVDVPPYEAGDLGRALDQVPGVVVHVHLDQHIARKELSLRNGLLAVFHFDDFFDRHQDLTELVLHRGTGNALDQGAHAPISRNRNRRERRTSVLS
jgi:hypothetical protein